MSRPERLLHFGGSIMRTSASGLAWLADIDTADEPVWLPKSECEYEGGDFIVPEWLAKEKGIAP